MNFRGRCMALILIILVFAFISTVDVFAAVNLALNKPVEASGYFKEAAQDESPPMAVDGDIDTKWCARPQELPEGEDYHWLIVDLEEEKQLGKYVIKNASLCAIDYGKYEFNMIEFSIEVSLDKENWTVVDEQYVGDLDFEDYEIVEGYFAEPVTARYVKLNAIIPTASGDQTVRLPEFELYEYDPNVTPPPTPTPTPTQTAKPQVTVSPSQIATPQPTDSNTSSTTRPNLAIFFGIGVAVVLIGGAVTFVLSRKKNNIG